MRRLLVNMREKADEAMASVLPIVAIVWVLCALAVPMSTGVLLTFLTGSGLLVAGMMLFTMGSEMSISPMGGYVGSFLTRSRSVPLIIGVAFFLGLIITISEPDLQVLAGLVPGIPNMTLIVAVGLGVGIFLVLALLRMLFKIRLQILLMVSYALVICFAFMVPRSFLAIAFDSGGVTTGPMTVPFIMSLGVGVAALRSDKGAADDSFGLISLCSVGPVMAVMVLGMIFTTEETQAVVDKVVDAGDTVEMFGEFLKGLPEYIREIAVALLPLLGFMVIFQLFVLRLSFKKLKRIGMGLIYTYVGLVLFLTGANVGFMPAGNLLGHKLATGAYPYMLIPVGAIMGYFIVRAEPAVYVLNKQVEEMTDGNISAKAMGTALSIGVAASIGISMLRVLTGIPILAVLVPGYLLALFASIFVPPMYTAIAFDSGGVASGPMTAAFLVPLAQGACQASGGNMMTDAFGVVAMVAMTPLITIQVMGILAELKRKKKTKILRELALEYSQMDDDAIILL